MPQFDDQCKAEDLEDSDNLSDEVRLPNAINCSIIPLPHSLGKDGTDLSEITAESSNIYAQKVKTMVVSPSKNAFTPRRRRSGLPSRRHHSNRLLP